MANLTTAARDEIRGKETITTRIENAIEVFIGSYVALNNATGGITLNADTAGFINYGRVVEFDSPLQGALGTVSATGDPTGTVKAVIDLMGGVIRRVPVTGASTDSDVGAQVSLATDNLGADIKLAANANTPRIGEIVRFISSTEFDILLYDQETMRGF